MSNIGHFCHVCGEELPEDADVCPQHPDAQVDSIEGSDTFPTHQIGWLGAMYERLLAERLEINVADLQQTVKAMVERGEEQALAYAQTDAEASAWARFTEAYDRLSEDDRETIAEGFQAWRYEVGF